MKAGRYDDACPALAESHRLDPRPGGLFTLVLPLASLVVGDAVLGAEVRKGTFHFTWLSPVPRWQIAVGRWLGGWSLVALTVAPAFALAAVIAGSPDNA